MTLTELILDRLSPWLTSASDPTGDHANYLTALAQMGEPLFSLIMDQGFPDDPGWQPGGFAVLFDVDICPTQYLPFLAQCVGVTIPPGTADATARQMIRAEQGFQRGTPGAIVAAAKRFLSGAQGVTLFERTAADGVTADAYHFVLVVKVTEILSVSGLMAAVDAVRPAGVQWTLVQAAAWTIGDLEAAGYADIGVVEATFPLISNLETDVP